MDDSIDLGIFTHLLTETVDHLRYLSMYGPEENDMLEAIARLREVLAQSDNVEEEILAGLLNTLMWRSTIVAVISVVCLNHASQELLERLWEVLDAGSWVTPQIAAVLFFYDAEFEQKAIARVKQGCPLTDQPLFLSESEKQLWGSLPSDAYLRQCKAVSSLVSMLEKSQKYGDIFSDEKVKQMLEDDIDHGGQIAKDWLNRVRVYFKL
ncbi:MAG: hypothetical protein ACOYYS_10800 [Chloroflexota bacterium]